MKTQANDSERSTNQPAGEVLKPCPFCGGKAQRLEGDGRWCQIGCTGCSGKGGEYPNDWPRAIASWNTRPLPQGERAVAWRWKVSANCGWSYSEDLPCFALEVSEPLFTRPASDTGWQTPKGWRLVPEELTDEMIAAQPDNADTHPPTYRKALWRAQLAALSLLPAPPTQEDGR